ncbi:MAG: hemerythrin domain-containing protein [Candidatus Pacearchaeota archaeon]|jgi:hemerythrin-like domain-containing protein
MPLSIEKLMLQEHKRINKCIDDLEKHLNDYEKTKIHFSTFKWNLEKHFFVEEKVIFDMFIDISGEETNDIFHLLQDHVKIMQIIRVLEKNLNKKIKPDLEDLKQRLTLHKEFEDQDFYPNLDKRLTPDQKKKIAERIREIIPA